MSDNKSNVGVGQHRSFLHHDSYSGLWRRDLQLHHHSINNINNSGANDLHNRNTIKNGGGVRLTSVRHRREDSDDIRSDSSSDHQSDHGDNTGVDQIHFQL